MPRGTSRAPKAKTPLIALSSVAPKLGGQTQVVRTIRRALFPREYFKCVGVLAKSTGVLELNGAQCVREFNCRAGFPSGATARGVGHAKPSNLAL
jgi:hypothetical protein